jgi:predicted RNA-binding Zn-ribbon protein involved in translation (DUF1610 family)
MKKTNEETGPPPRAQLVRALGCLPQSGKTYTAYVEFKCPHCGNICLVRLEQPRQEDAIRAVCEKCKKEVRL